MRIVKLLAVPVLAAVSLTGCSSSVDGSADPSGSKSAAGSGSASATNSSTADEADFDKTAAQAVLLDETDLPDHTALPAVDLDQLSKGLGAGNASNATVEPAKCSNAFTNGSVGAAQKDILEKSAVAMFSKSSSPADISIVAEFIGPAALIKPEIEKLDVPTECKSIKVTLGGQTMDVSMEELPIDIGSTSTGLKVTLKGEVAGQSTNMTITTAVIAEKTGGVMVTVMGGDLESIAQKAYDKALPVLK